ncbi:hypothetical protein JOF29_002822 [Kribbella aluminosa]|uniref:Uncharacterized protein n=1 Tax=Kribbella aluminosa TaxID=416017 RepID=A0ABS4UJF0_9ACTN|nr:hypothetical protein [Kribbella aluminosa]MBP2351739.1 hypothetical protein [Kribbella aluminosa]
MALAIERYDERVADAEMTYEAVIAELARICRSAEAAAEIFSCSLGEVRRVVKAERERRTSAQIFPGGADFDD